MKSLLRHLWDLVLVATLNAVVLMVMRAVMIDVSQFAIGFVHWVSFGSYEVISSDWILVVLDIMIPLLWLVSTPTLFMIWRNFGEERSEVK